MTAPTQPAFKVAWLALRDGVAHAHRGARPARAICGTPAVSERDAWPEHRRCLVCTKVVAEREGRLPLEDNMARGRWGDR